MSWYRYNVVVLILVIWLDENSFKTFIKQFEKLDFSLILPSKIPFCKSLATQVHKYEHTSQTKKNIAKKPSSIVQ